MSFDPVTYALAKGATKKAIDNVLAGGADLTQYYKKGEVDLKLADKADKTDIPVIPEKISAFENDAGYLTIGDIPEYPTLPTKVSELLNDTGFITLEDLPNVPSKVSELTNDTGFITSDDIPDIPVVPTKVSAFENDSGYITKSDIPKKISEIENDVGYVTYGDIPVIPPIPSKVSDLTNDTGFITSDDLPAVPSKVSELTNDSGYITADDIPTIPTVPTKLSEFENDTEFITADDIPASVTKVSELENDAGYITADDIPAAANVPTKVSELENDSGYLTNDDTYTKDEIDSKVNDSSFKIEKVTELPTTDIKENIIYFLQDENDENKQTPYIYDGENWIKVSDPNSGTGTTTEYTLPTMSSTEKGGAKLGDTLEIDGEVLQVKNPFTEEEKTKLANLKDLKDITPEELDINNSDKIMIGVGGEVKAITYEHLLDNLNNDITFKEYELPTASDTVLGGVKIGNTLVINNGVVDVEHPFTTTDKDKLDSLKTLDSITTEVTADDVDITDKIVIKDDDGEFKLSTLEIIKDKILENVNVEDSNTTYSIEINNYEIILKGSDGTESKIEIPRLTDPTGVPAEAGATYSLSYNVDLHRFELSNDKTTAVQYEELPFFTGATENENGKAGLVPTPNKTDKDKFLRGDGTWTEIDLSSLTPSQEAVDYALSFDQDTSEFVLLADNTDEQRINMPTMVGATVDSSGKVGLVPVPPIKGSKPKFLSDDGTWVEVNVSNTSGGSTTPSTGNDITYELTFDNENGELVVTTDGVNEQRVTIPDFVGATATEGGVKGFVPAPSVKGSKPKFLSDDGTWVEIDTSAIGGSTSTHEGEDITYEMTFDYLTGDLVVTTDGENEQRINIPTFLGSSSENDGSLGLVPAPTTTDTNKFLRSDGLWAEIPTNSGSGSGSGTTTPVIIEPTIGEIQDLFELTGASGVTFSSTRSGEYVINNGVLYFSFTLNFASTVNRGQELVKFKSDAGIEPIFTTALVDVANNLGAIPYAAHGYLYKTRESGTGVLRLFGTNDFTAGEYFFTGYTPVKTVT